MGNQALNQQQPHWVWILFLIIVAFSVLFPFMVMLSGAFSLDKGVSFNNLQTVWQKIPFLQYTLNSLWVATLSSLGQLLLASLAAYGFSKLQFKYKNALFFAVLLTMMVPPQVNLVPLFMVVKHLGMLDTHWALIIPAWFGVFGIFMLRQWFLSLPDALFEAAWLDGCTHWQYFFKVALPLVKPALVALGLYCFIANYNSLMWPLISIHSEGLRTLPLGIVELKNTYRDAIDWGVLMAASFLSILPILILYLVGQKQLQQGLMQGALKG